MNFFKKNVIIKCLKEVYMKFFILSLSFLLVLLGVTIFIGVYKGFSTFVIIGIALVSVSVLSTIFIYFYNRNLISKEKKADNSNKIENDKQD